MQLSQMLKSLEGKGLISRRRNDADLRAKEVCVTRSGLSVLREALPLAIQVQAKLFGDSGRPKGHLHETLLEIDRALAEIEE